MRKKLKKRKQRILGDLHSSTSDRTGNVVSDHLDVLRNLQEQCGDLRICQTAVILQLPELY